MRPVKRNDNRALLATVLVGATLGVPGIGHAGQSADERIAELERKLGESLTLIGQLTTRVSQLEGEAAEQQQRVAAVPSAATSVAEPVEPAPAPPPMIDRDSQYFENGIPIHGFADVGFGTHNPLYPDIEGFNVGQLELYLNPRIGERTLALFEMNFEINDEGETGADLERAQIGYQFSDRATVWLGRYHTPFGYYNTAFHHGQQIATSLRRPRFLQFEDAGGVMPVHTTGLWLTGTDRLASGRLTYDLYVGNAQAIVDGNLDPRTAGNDQGDTIYGANVGYRFEDAYDGLKLGISGFSVEISDDQALPNRTRVNMLNAYLVFDTDRWENLLEYYRFDNDDLSSAGASHRSSAGYVQLGYRLPFGTTYARYEQTDLDQDDPYFAQQLSGMSYDREAVGLRYDIDEKAALKVELSETRVTDRIEQQWNELLLQYAIRF